MQDLKAFKHYPGGKNGSGTYQTIINHIPPHKRYIEAFLGNGAIIRCKKKAEINIGNDVDCEVFIKWQELNLPDINLYNEDALVLLQGALAYGKDTVIYIDPPYVMSSRKSKNDLYKHEMTDEQHIKLLSLVNQMHSNVIISTYPNELYADALKNWNCYKFNNITRKGSVIELLYCNFKKPIKLHDYKYLGNNFRERARISNKIKRWVSRLENLPILERNAVIEKLLISHHQK